MVGKLVKRRKNVSVDETSCFKRISLFGGIRAGAAKTAVKLLIRLFRKSSLGEFLQCKCSLGELLREVKH